MGENRDRYTSFILALWREGDALRCRLENPRTGERFGFKSVAELAHFLEEQMEAAAHPDPEMPDATQ